MNKEQIEKLQGQIESVLAASVDPEDGHLVKAQLADASRLLVTSTNCITAAKNIYLSTHAAWLRQHMEKIAEMKPSVAKLYTDTAVVDEQILLTRCEANYKNLCRYSDNLVTILSYLKAEMSIQ